MKSAEEWAKYFDSFNRNHMYGCGEDLLQGQADFIREIQQDALRSQPQAVAPEGWQLVPKELTEEMLVAGDAMRGKQEWVYRMFREKWKAVLAAAPKPTASEP